MLRERNAECEKLKLERDKRTKDWENARIEVKVKDTELRKLSHELENATHKLELASNLAAHDRRMELMHEIELLREEKEGVTERKEEAIRVNERLNQELSQLQQKLQISAVELKNENRRHGLLTKEFNSLLEENSRLKVQLRRRICSQETQELKKDPSSVHAVPMDNKEPISVLARVKMTYQNSPSPPGATRCKTNKFHRRAPDAITLARASTVTELQSNPSSNTL